MRSNAPQKLWESGVPLSDAWIEFAPPDLRYQLDATGGFFEVFEQSATASPDSDIGSAILSGLTAKTNRDALIRVMRDHLLDELFNSELRAFGIRVLPSKSARPINIDPNLFEAANIHWHNATVEWLGYAFVQVRVFDPRNRHEGNLQKGSRAAIDAAINELKLANPDFCNLPRKSACDLVRDKIGIAEIKGNGLTNQNISKRILERCPKREIKINSN